MSVHSRYGYELSPTTVEEALASALGQIAVRDDPEFQVRLDGVFLTADALADIAARLLAVEERTEPDNIVGAIIQSQKLRGY